MLHEHGETNEERMVTFIRELNKAKGRDEAESHGSGQPTAHYATALEATRKK